MELPLCEVGATRVGPKAVMVVEKEKMADPVGLTNLDKLAVAVAKKGGLNNLRVSYAWIDLLGTSLNLAVIVLSVENAQFRLLRERHVTEQ